MSIRKVMKIDRLLLRYLVIPACLMLLLLSVYAFKKELLVIHTESNNSSRPPLTTVEPALSILSRIALTYSEEQIVVTSTDTCTACNNKPQTTYTFSFPEGAIVSAFALWFNGIETNHPETTKP